MSFEGFQDILIQYLQLVLNFQTADNAKLLVVMSASGLAVKCGLLVRLVAALGEQRVLLLSLAAYLVVQVMMALALSKVFILAAVAVGGFSGLSLAALVAMQTWGVPPTRQGAVNGALLGAGSMAQGIGPLVFAAVFAAFTRTDTRLPYAPWAPWVVAMALTLVAAAVAVTLPRSMPAAAAATAASRKLFQSRRSGSLSGACPGACV